MDMQLLIWNAVSIGGTVAIIGALVGAGAFLLVRHRRRGHDVSGRSD